MSTPPRRTIPAPRKFIKAGKFLRQRTWYSKRVYDKHDYKRFAADSKFPIMRSNGITFCTYNFEFKLSDVPNYTEFTALYDQYRIRKVVCRFIPKQSSSMLMPYDASGSVGNTIIPRMWAAVDYDDSSALTSIDEIKQYSKAQAWPFTQKHSVVISPKVDKAIYNTAISTAYGPAGGVWIDCGNPDVPHYGLKLIGELDAATLPANEDGPHFYQGVECLYYLEFKNVR